jgi:hypothetical protein
MSAPPFYDTAAAADRIERERQLIAHGINPFASIPPTITAQVSAPSRRSSPGHTFDAGVQHERRAATFGIALRKAIAARLRNRSEGSNDTIACALLDAEEKEFRVEAALPLRTTELTPEQKDFAARLIAKIKTLRPEARRRSNSL